MLLQLFYALNCSLFIFYPQMVYLRICYVNMLIEKHYALTH